MSREMNRGPDPWANVETGHLSPAKRREAEEAKADIIEVQGTRKIRRSPYETGEIEPFSMVIDSLEKFIEFCRLGIEIASNGPTVVILETRGDSDKWVSARKRLDGEDFRKNRESTGVTVVLINILVRNGVNKIAFINFYRQRIPERWF